MSISSSTYAVFLISLLASVTSTIKLTSVSDSLPTVTSIPFFKLSEVNSVLFSPPTFTLPSTNFVPSGTSSFTIAFPSNPPLFFTFILYVILSPFVTYANPLDNSASLLTLITGSTYVFSVVSVGTSFTVAVFLISVPLSMLFTVTLNVTVLVPYSAIPTFIPCAKSSSV